MERKKRFKLKHGLTEQPCSNHLHARAVLIFIVLIFDLVDRNTSNIVNPFTDVFYHTCIMTIEVMCLHGGM